MGHVINPISTRLGINVFWNSFWSLNQKFNYSLMNKNNLFLFKFLTWIFNFRRFRKKNIIFTHYYIYINNLNQHFINIYYYWPGLDLYKQRRRKNKFRPRYSNLKKKKFHWWKKKKKMNKFFKRKLYPFLFKFFLSHLYWYVLSHSWMKYCSVHLPLKYKFFIYNVDFLKINVGVISTYICKRLIQRHALRFTLKPVLRDLHVRLKQRRIQGYRILCAGRFTRRQIAEKNWYKQGPVPNNNFSSLIHYQQSKIRLKYGTCGIKVWINYGIHQKSSYLEGYKLIFPTSKKLQYAVVLDKNFYTLLISNISWSLLFFRWSYNKLLYNYYAGFIQAKLFYLLYKKFIRFLYKELLYLLFLKINKYNKHKRYKKYNRYNRFNRFNRYPGYNRFNKSNQWKKKKKLKKFKKINKINWKKLIKNIELLINHQFFFDFYYNSKTLKFNFIKKKKKSKKKLFIYE